MKTKSIAIIGAGISGLVTANAMQQWGYAVTIFEKCSTTGEVWGRSIFFVGEVAQTVKKDYTFYGAGLPPLSCNWPDGEEMQQYLQCYATKTGINKHIIFHTTVQKLHFERNGWKLLAWNEQEGRHAEFMFDAVIVCTGFEPNSYSAGGGTVRFKGKHISSIFSGKEPWPLYRNILAANAGCIGFIGIHGGLYFTLTATIAAHWMAAYLSGTIASPAQLPQESRFKRYSKKNQLSQLIRYLNLLLKDMGYRPLPGNNPLLRLLGASFDPEAYAAATNMLTNCSGSSSQKINITRHMQST